MVERSVTIKRVEDHTKLLWRFAPIFYFNGKHFLFVYIVKQNKKFRGFYKKKFRGFSQIEFFQRQINFK